MILQQQTTHLYSQPKTQMMLMIYIYYISILTSLFDDACPLKQIRVKRKYIKREPWVTSGILTSSINKSKLLRKKLNKLNRQNIEMYKNYSRIFNALKRAAKAIYYIDILNKHKKDITKTWTVLQQAISKQKAFRKLPQTFVIN